MLIHDYRQLEGTKLKNIKCKFYYDDLVILYCGNYLKYGRLVKKKMSKKGKNQNIQLRLSKMKGNEKLTFINCNFNDDVEIINIVETQEHDIVQIIK